MNIGIHTIYLDVAIHCIISYWGSPCRGTFPCIHYCDGCILDRCNIKRLLKRVKGVKHK